MRKITILTMITLDGVMQAPGGPEEDSSAGFKYGGWTAPYGDKEGDEAVKQELSEPVDYILGRKTFDIWEGYWPHHADFWPGINEGTKYVLTASRRSSDWKNTVFIDSVEEIKKLKNTEGRNIQVWGSSELVQLLLKHDLADELRLKIYPITLGKGKRLFGNGIMSAAFRLMSSTITSTGVILANYKRAGNVRTGTIDV